MGKPFVPDVAHGPAVGRSRHLAPPLFVYNGIGAPRHQAGTLVHECAANRSGEDFRVDFTHRYCFDGARRMHDVATRRSLYVWALLPRRRLFVNVQYLK